MELKTFETLDEAIIQLHKFIQGKDYRAEVVIRDIYPARYDYSPINNIAGQLEKGAGFTDQQQELAIKLVTKYRKQWKKIGYDVSNIDINTPVKAEVRTDVDRSRYIDIVDGKIAAKFPFNPKLISLFYNLGERACGKTQWNKPAKRWEMAITAENAYWANTFANDHKFNKTPAFTDLIERIDNAYDHKSIQLDIVDRKLVLHNAPETMLEWIQNNIGRVEMRNFVKIVGLSNMLAFTLSKEVIEYVVRNYPDLYLVILQRRSHLSPDVELLKDLLLRVKKLDYDNVVFFLSDPGTENHIVKTIMAILPEYDLWSEQKSAFYKKDTYNEQKLITITNKALSTQPDLIVSFAGFMAGPIRKAWFDRAGKVIYYCQDIDNKIKKTITKDESNFNYKR